MTATASDENAVRQAMAPTAEVIAGLRQARDEAIAAELLAARRGRVLDVGCGKGSFTRALAAIFASVSGVDVSAKSIAAAKEAAASAGVGVDFRIASGEALPYADGWFDTVIFSNSLHHMPDPDAALREAARVLAADGLLYVMEPVPAGSFFEATRLVNDETIVRTEAYRALQRLARAGFAPQAEIMYRERRRMAGFDEWHADQIERNPERQKLFDAQPGEVRRRFEANALREDGALAFDQVLRVNLLRKAAGR
jgi:ubiquinone/menaquinone biosynthesis C-methylase UbiE